MRFEITSEQLELKLGMGGTSYEDFIRQMHLPLQLRYIFGTQIKLGSNSHFEQLVKYSFWIDVIVQ
jgi:hypothetical protein